MKHVLAIASLLSFLAVLDVLQKSWIVVEPRETNKFKDSPESFVRRHPVFVARIPYKRQDSDDESSNDVPRHPENEDMILPYSTENIVRTVHTLAMAPARLLMYHPSNNRFVVYTVAPTNSSERQMHTGLDICLRCKHVLPILIDALLVSRPDRFQPDKPPFQMFFSIADFTTSHCMKDGHDCSDTAPTFAPWVHFGSTFRDATVLPTVQVMPTSNYLMCLEEWRWDNTTQMCTKWPLINTTYEWKDLIPKVIWRGTGFTLLPAVGKRWYDGRNETRIEYLLDPRQRAHYWTETNNSSDYFLDAKIVPFRRPSMSRNEMSKYKYQIDFGGVGGTTWTGTLTKLFMPGLLLHHETPTMDWFFHELKPWYHYIPVRTDLTDLKEKFDWAEHHPDDARRMARQGTDFVEWFFSNAKMQYEYEAMLERLGNVVDSYVSMESVSSMIDTYKGQNVSVTQHSICTKAYCDIFIKYKTSTRLNLPPR